MKSETSKTDVTLKDVIHFLLNLKIKNIFSALVVFIATFSCFTLFINKLDLYLHNCSNSAVTKPEKAQELAFWVYGRNIESGYLKHVFAVLDRLGYKKGSNSSNWGLLWAHDYPFRSLYSQLYNLKPHQKVNHFPGCGYITNKVDLSTSRLKYLPVAFKLPSQKDEVLKYSRDNPEKMFVLKSNDHRGIQIQKIQDVDLESDGSFIQEYISKPYLVDGYKFDIGVYTIITSIDPLRVYIYNGDVLFRYCPEKYYPFDAKNLNKYVVGDDYLPTWEVPSLKYYYNVLGFSMKSSFDAYVKDSGQNPSKMWKKVEDAIRHVILAKEEQIINVLQRFKSKRNFFEMMRFDLVVDENLEVYLMEANMSPNLSSAHYAPNQLLYEQVIYNLFSLIGIGDRIRKSTLASRSKEEEMMQTDDKNLVVFPKECHSPLCRNSCMSPVCQLCKPCLSPETKIFLIQAYKEYLNRLDCKRIFPPPMNQVTVNSSMDLEMYSAENQIQYRWFVGKCLLDASWCG